MGKALGITLIIIGVLLGVGYFLGNIYAGYKYTNDYSSQWSLADKSSTIQAKADYINSFVSKIEANKNQFADHDAIILKTQDNSFENNLNALKTLRDRLKTISTMNESDFAYQTAIQQITAQEQGEAQALLAVIQGSYYLRTYPVYWGWIQEITLAIIFGIIALGFVSYKR